jgi:hypothetical protein
LQTRVTTDYSQLEPDGATKPRPYITVSKLSHCKCKLQCSPHDAIICTVQSCTHDQTAYQYSGLVVMDYVHYTLFVSVWLVYHHSNTKALGTTIHTPGLMRLLNSSHKSPVTYGERWGDIDANDDDSIIDNTGLDDESIGIEDAGALSLNALMLAFSLVKDTHTTHEKNVSNRGEHKSIDPDHNVLWRHINKHYTSLFPNY